MSVELHKPHRGSQLVVCDFEGVKFKILILKIG